MKIVYYILLPVILFTACTKQQPQLEIEKNQQNQIQNSKEVKSSTKEVLQIPFKFTLQNNTQKLALLYSSKKIGHYAIDASNTVMAYMINSEKEFDLQVIDMEDESEESFKKAFEQLENNNIKNIVAVVTNESYDKFTTIEEFQQFQIFLPLIHKNNIQKEFKNIIYGGVDYKKQFETLLKYSNGKDIEFYDNSLFGETLNKQLNQVNNRLLYTQEIDGFSRFYGDFLKKDEKKISKSTLFLDTPVVKSSILLSQLRANDIVTNRVLSTQINYTPLILTLTQTDDRKNLIVANSIASVEPQLRESIVMLNSDIVYDWLNYATLMGVEYFISEKKNILKIVDNQVEHNIRLYKAKYYSFVELR